MHADLALPKRAAEAAAFASRAEQLGFDGLWCGETRSDPFLVLALASQAGARVRLGTGVAIAFARTPMTLAYTAYELAGLSRGRFVLGLGSQVEAHVRRRFSMPWSAPAARMREFVQALRAIWAAWHGGTKLEFRGEHYRHDLMTPYFSPERHAFGPPPVMLAGVGARMTEIAGEVCDGFLFHPFTTERYLREVSLPALARGRARAGKTLDGFRVCGPLFASPVGDERERGAVEQASRQQFAFWASTPAYRPVLELHGWGELQTELASLARAGRWSELADAVDPGIFEAFACIEPPEKLGARLVERFGALVDGVTFGSTHPVEPERLGPAVQALHHAAPRSAP
jgi:probable F420-dependent oxidoreductase